MSEQVAEQQVRVNLRIRGQVQGVWYRASAREEGRRLGLVGWVRNCPDGTVELEAEGPEAAVERLIRWCWEGSPAARVSDVAVERIEPRGEEGAFAVRH